MQAWPDGQRQITGRTATPPCVVCGQVVSRLIRHPIARHWPDLSGDGREDFGAGFTGSPEAFSADQTGVGREKITAAKERAKSPGPAFMSVSERLRTPQPSPARGLTSIRSCVDKICPAWALVPDDLRQLRTCRVLGAHSGRRQRNLQNKKAKVGGNFKKSA